MCQYLREVGTLLLAAGEDAEGSFGKRLNAHGVHCPPNNLFILAIHLSEESVQREAPHAHYVDRTQGQDKTRGMELPQVSDVPNLPAGAFPKNFYFPTQRRQESHNSLKESTLTRTVGANKGNSLSRMKIEINA
jgi:hypothetical protein